MFASQNTLRKAASAGLRFFFIFSILFMGTIDLSAKEPKSVDIEKYGVRPGTGEDSTEGVRKALEACRAGKIRRLVFAPGRYDFWPDRAVEKYLFVSNNDESLKRIAFPITGFDGLEIDGNGAQFVFHGFIIPFVIENSKNVTIKKLSVDFARTFHSEGKVLAVTKNSVDLEISDEFPYKTDGGFLVFHDEKTATPPQQLGKPRPVYYAYGTLLAFDPVKRETAYMAGDKGVRDAMPVKEIGPHQVRITVSDVAAEPGNVLCFGASRRACPGFVISGSRKTLLEEIDLYHCGGMGIIAQCSADIDLEKVRVTPPPGGKRVISITADATHFVNCTGKITMRDCLFEMQKDDATNIHGLYVRIERILGPDQIEVRLVHPQQAGIDFIRPGMKLEVVDGPSIVTRGYVNVKSVERVNKEYTLVTLAGPLPEGSQVGDAVADADSNNAEVLIENCVIRGNRARGLLIGSRGKTVIVGNTFHTPGTAILFEGDACKWFEQAGVRDVTIRKNIFDNCNFGPWGSAVIAVGAGIDPTARKTSRYNQNIVIEENVFRLFGPRGILKMYSVDGLKFRGNVVERTNAYPPQQEPQADLCKVTDSDRVEVTPPQEAR